MARTRTHLPLTGWAGLVDGRAGTGEAACPVTLLSGGHRNGFGRLAVAREPADTVEVSFEGALAETRASPSFGPSPTQLSKHFTQCDSRTLS